jgi:hypothetical protein
VQELTFVWTDHAWKRLKERKIPEHFITSTLASPDKTFTKQDFSKELQKKFGQQTVTFIVKKNNRGEYVMISCWIDPPMAGTKDARRRKRYLNMRNTKGLKKIWLLLLYKLSI